MNDLSARDQVTFRLSPELNGALRAAARQMHRKPSEVIRQALRQYLAVPGPDGCRPAERVRGLVGSLDSALTDPAATHRAAVLDRVKNGR